MLRRRRTAARIARAFAADDHRRAAAAASAAAAAPHRPGVTRADPGQRQVLDIGLIDLLQRAVTLARVVARISGPRVAQRLLSKRGVECLRCERCRQYEISERGERLLSFQGHQISSQVMNVFVGVSGQQILVRLQRIVNFNLRDIAIAAESALRAIGFGQSDDEIVDAHQAGLPLSARKAE